MESFVIVEPVSSGLQLIAAVVDAGYRPIILTADEGDRQVPESYKTEGTLTVQVDTHDLEALIACAQGLAAQHKIVGVVAGFEYFVPAAAHIAAALGLPGLPVETVACLRDKELMRRRLDAAGVASARWQSFSLDELENLDSTSDISSLVFPVVVKPANLSGSMGVRRCDSLAEVLSYAKEVRRLGLNDLDEKPRAFLVEEYIEGPELSVEGLVAGARITLVSMTRKMLGREPSFVETGHVVSPDNFTEHRLEIRRYIEQVASALAITRGAFHAELRLHPRRGPVLMEIAARLPGDHLCELIKDATAVDLIAHHIACYTSEQTAAIEEPKEVQTIGIRFVCGQAGSLVPTVDWRLLKETFPSMRSFGMELSPGSRVASESDFQARMLRIVLQAASAEGFIRESSRIEQLILEGHFDSQQGASTCDNA